MSKFIERIYGEKVVLSSKTEDVLFLAIQFKRFPGGTFMRKYQDFV